MSSEVRLHFVSTFYVRTFNKKFITVTLAGIVVVVKPSRTVGITGSQHQVDSHC